MASCQTGLKWSSILVIITYFNLPRESSAQDSCRGRCGNEYKRGYKCQCDFDCLRYDECCKDYRALCTSDVSCSGRCYEVHERGRKCQCDSKCMEFNECCSDFIANCTDPQKDPTTFMPTTRSTSVFTRKPLTTKRPELISNIMIEQDSASYLDKEIKSMHEPTKSGNEIINLSKGPTIMNPTNFRLLENIMEENTVVTEVSSTMDPNLKTDTNEKSTVTKKLVSSRVKDRPPQATFYDQSVRTNPNSLNKEGTVSAIPKISQSFVPSNVITMDPDNSDNAATVKSLTPEEVETMLPNLNKAGRTTSIPDIDPDVANKDTAWTTIPSIFLTMYSELVQSFALNRSITVNPDNSDDGETIKPMAEEVATNIPKLDKEGIRSTVPEDRTLGFKILDKEGTTKPFTPEEDIMDSKSLNEVTIAQPTVTEVKIKDSKMFSKEKATMSPADEDGTKGSQLVEKEGITKAAVPEDSTIDSKLLHIEATTKSTIAEDDTVTFEPLDNGSTNDMTSEGSVTIFHKTTQFFDSNRAIHVHSDNTTKIQPIPPEDITVITPYLNREGTTKQLAPKGSGTMDSNKSDEEIPTTVPEKYQTTFTEIAAPLSTASIFEPENLEIAPTLLPIPPEEALTELPNKEKGTTKHPVPDDGAAVSKVFDKEGTVKAAIVEDNALNSESSDSEEMETTVPAGRTTMHPEITRSFAANTATSVDPHKLDNLATIQPTPEEAAPTLLDLSKVRKTQPSVESASSLKSNTLVEAETTFPKMEKEGTIKPTVPEDTTDSKILDQDNKTKSNVPEKEHIIDSNIFDKETKTTFTITEHGTLNSESLDHEETTIVPKESTMEFKILDGEESTKVPVPEYAPMDSKSFGKEGTTKPTSEGSSTMDPDKVGIKETQTAFTEKQTTTYPEISETLAPIRATALAKLENATTVQPVSSKESVTILPNLPKEETAKLSVSEEHIMDSRTSDKEVIIKPTSSEDNSTDSKSLDEERLTMATVKADSTTESKFVEQDRTTKYIVPEEVSSTNSKVFDTDGITNAPTDEGDTIYFESLDNEGTKSPVPKDHSSNSKMMHNEGLTKAYDPDYSSMDSKSLEKEGITKPYVIEDSSMVKEAKTLPSTPDEGTMKTKSQYKEVTTKSTVAEKDSTTDSYFSDKGGPTKPTVTEHGTMISESLESEEIHTTASRQFIATHPKIPQSLALHTAFTVDPDNLNYAETIQTIASENAVTIVTHKDKNKTTKVHGVSEATLSDNSDKEEMQASVPEEHATLYFEVSQSVVPTSLGPNNLENTTAIQPISSVQPVTILSKLTKEATANLFTPEDDPLDSKSSDKEATMKPIIPSDGTIESKSVHSDRTTNHPVQDDDSTDSNVLVRDRTTKSPPDEDGTTNMETLDNEETKPAVPEDTSADSKISDNEGLTKAHDVQYSSTDFTSLEKDGITKPHFIEDGSMVKEATTQLSTPDEGTTKSKSQYKEVTTKSTVAEKDSTTDSYFSDKGGPTKPTVTEHGTMISESLESEEIHTTASRQFIATHPKIPQSLALHTAFTVDPDNLNYAETIQTIASENAVTIVTHKDKNKTTKVHGVSEATLSDNSDKEEMQASVPEEHATLYFEVSQSVVPTSLGPNNLENTTAIQPISSVQPVTILSKLTKEATANLFTPEDDPLDSKSSDKEATMKPIIPSDGTIESKSVHSDRTTNHPVQDDDSTDSNVLVRDRTTKSPPDEDGTTNMETLDNEETKPAVPEDTSADSKISDNEGLTKAHDVQYSSTDFTSLEKDGITKPHFIEDGSMVKEATTQLSTPDEGTTKSKSQYKEVTTKSTVAEKDSTTDSYFSDKGGPTKPTVTEHGTMISESLESEEIHTTASRQFIATHPKIPQSLALHTAFTVDPDNLNYAETIQTIASENAVTIVTHKDKNKTTKVHGVSEATLSDNSDKEEMQASVPEEHATLYFEVSQSVVPTSLGPNSLENTTAIQPISSVQPVTILSKLTKEATANLFPPEDDPLDSKSSDKEATMKPIIPSDGTIKSKSLDKDRTTKHTVQDDDSIDSNILVRDRTTKSPPDDDGTTNMETLDNEETKPAVPEDTSADSKLSDNEGLTKAYNVQYSSTHFTSFEKDGITMPYFIEDGSMVKEATTLSSTPDEGTTKSKSQYKEVTTKSTVAEKDGTTDSYFSDKGGPAKPTATEHGTMISESLESEEIHTTASRQFIATHPKIPQSLAPHRAVTVDPDNLNYAETIQTENAATMFSHKEGTSRVPEESETTVSDNSDREQMQTTDPEEHATMNFEVSQSVVPTSLGPDNLEKTKTIQPFSSVQPLTILSKLTKEATANLFTPEDDPLDSKSSDKEATIKPIIPSDGTIESKSLDKDRTTKHTVQDDDSTDSNILVRDRTTKSPPDEDGTTKSETLDNEETKPGVPENTSPDSKISDNEGLTKVYDRDYSLMDFTSLEKEGVTKPHVTEGGSMMKEATTQLSTPDEGTTNSKSLFKEVTMKFTVQEDGTVNPYFSDKERPTKPTVTQHNTKISESLDNEEIHTTAFGQFPAIHPEIQHSLDPNRAVTVDSDNLNNAETATTNPTIPENNNTDPKNLDKEESMKFTVTDNDTIQSKSVDEDRTTKHTVLEDDFTDSNTLYRDGTINSLTAEDGTINSEILDHEGAKTTVPEHTIPSKILSNEGLTKAYNPEYSLLDSKSLDKEEITKPSIIEDGSMGKEATTQPSTPDEGTTKSISLYKEVTTKSIVPEDDVTTDSYFSDKEGPTKPTVTEDGTMISESLDNEEIYTTASGRFIATHPEIQQSLDSNRAVTVDSDNLNNAGTIQTENAATIFPHREGTTKVPERSETTVSDNLDKEIQTSVPKKYSTTYFETSTSYALIRTTFLSPGNLENGTTIKPYGLITSVEPPVIPNLTEEKTHLFTPAEDILDSKSPDKEGTIKPSTSEDDNNIDSKSLNKGEITKASGGTTESATVAQYRIAKSTIPEEGDNKTCTVLNNEEVSKPVVIEDDTMISETLDNEETKPTVHEDTTSDSKIMDSEGSTKDSGLENSIMVSKSFHKGGMTDLPITEDGMMDFEETTEPSILQSDPADSKSLYKEANTKPIVHNDNITDLKILDREKITMDSATINLKPSEKKWITKSIGLEEDGTTDSQFFDKAGKTKPSFAKDSTMITESLYNEEIQTITSLGFTAKYPGVSQNFVPNRAVIVDPDNLDTAETMQLIVPEDAASILPHKDIEGTTKPTLPEGSATMSSIDIDKGEKQTTFPEKRTTTYYEVSRSFALIRATSLGLDNLDKITTIKPNTFEKTQTMLQQPDKDRMTNPNLLEEHYSTESKVLDKESTTKTTPAEDGALNSESLGNEEAKPEGGTTDFKILDNRQLTKVSLPECGTMESKSFNKEGTTKPTVSEGSITMDSDKAGNEEIQTTVPKKCATVHPAISQTFAPNRAMSLSPGNLNDATIQLISRKEHVTILPNLNKEGTTKLSTPGIHTTHSNTSNKYNNTDSKILHKEETTMTTSNDVGMNESKSVEQDGTTKSTISEQTASLHSDGEDKKIMQTAVPEKSATIFLEISQTFSPNGGNTLGPDMLGNTATKQPITLEEAVTTLPNPDQEKITKLIVSEDFTEFSENLNIGGSTKPTIAEDGTLKSESSVNVETKTISLEESANVHLNFTESFVPNRTVTVQLDNIDNAVTVQSIPTEKSVIILSYLGKIGTSRPAAPEEGSLNSTSLEREGTTKSTVLSRSTNYLSSLQDKEQSQPTLQDADSIKSDTGIVKDGITQFTEAAEPARVPTLNKTSPTHVLEGIITVKPANLDIEGTTKTTKSITTGLNLKTETEKMIDLDKYTGKDSNVTTPAYLPQSSHDSKVTMVTKLSEAFRNQTTTKAPSYADHLNDPNLCDKRPSDALTTIQNGTTYIFRGHLFWTIDPNGPSLGHPRRISEVWGIPSPIDTVFTRCNCNGKTFFFKGEQYWRFQNGVMDSGYPRLITSGFSGLNGKIRAALSVAAHKNRPETVYFFKNGGRYQKYVYQQRVSTTCTLRPGTRANFVLRRRFKRKTLVIKTIRSQKSDITLTQESAQLSVEMSIRKNWRGFPLRITSAISLPKPERAEKYEYFVLSHDKYYTVDPANQKVTDTRRSVTKDLYGCD